ncbi:hypothetical protein [Capnocytophaga sp.]|uniref:hypothetical protein n=1 Tax=Capnocytophaga sp. TaxID=44737 RepID=UPI0026DD478A|nr:hypothetical protein [Capnocytophaga sp.]MDO5104575.1 hypothetical protein [Capnocytophaga sp.]
MKKFTLLFLLGGFFFTSGLAQKTATPDRYTAHNKGKFFLFWGENRGYFTKSDIQFKGDNYNFTLSDVQAEDRPKGWHIDYINPLRMTIPQTNARIGYFISDHYNISVGVDHMKYVMVQDQTVKINGFIRGSGTPHDGEYHNQDKVLTEDFLTFEHTDGLNYVTAEFSRVDDISKLFAIKNTDVFQVNLTEGLGIGVLYPRSNTKLLNKERYDEFHIAGYGMSAKAGLNLVFFKHFMILGELKGGYINMYDIRTTNSIADKASQDFFYFQTMFAIGGIFRF